GLQFVVVVLGAEARSIGPEVGAFGTPTVVHFCAALLISAILSVPWRAVSNAGLALEAVGVAGIVYMAVVIRRALRPLRYVPVLEDWLWHCAFPLVAYVTLLVAAFVLQRDPPRTLLVIGGTAVFLLIIDQEVAHAGGEGPLELRIVLDLDDHRQSGWGRPQRPGKISRPEQRPVVVFPEHGTSERVAILHPAAHRHRIGLERPQARCGLARMRDPRACSLDGFDHVTCDRRDAREALQEVESDALAREQRCCARPGARQHGAGRHP